MRPRRPTVHDHNSLGVHFYSVGAYDLAIAELETAVALAPEEARLSASCSTPGTVTIVVRTRYEHFSHGPVPPCPQMLSAMTILPEGPAQGRPTGMRRSPVPDIHLKL